MRRPAHEPPKLRCFGQMALFDLLEAQKEGRPLPHMSEADKRVLDELTHPTSSQSANGNKRQKSRAALLGRKKMSDRVHEYQNAKPLKKEDGPPIPTSDFIKKLKAGISPQHV